MGHQSLNSSRVEEMTTCVGLRVWRVAVDALLYWQVAADRTPDSAQAPPAAREASRRACAVNEEKRTIGSYRMLSQGVGESTAQ